MAGRIFFGVSSFLPTGKNYLHISTLAVSSWRAALSLLRFKSPVSRTVGNYSRLTVAVCGFWSDSGELSESDRQRCSSERSSLRGLLPLR